MEWIKCLALLPKNLDEPLLMRMLVPAPYQAPAKKDKKKKGKETKGGLHHEDTSGAMSGGTEAPSSHEGDEDEDEEEEEEEENPPLKGKKRAASVDPKEGSPRGERYPSRIIRIQAPKLSASTGLEPSPLPNRKYLRMPYIHPIFLSIIRTISNFVFQSGP